jgi:hypothetical protein
MNYGFDHLGKFVWFINTCNFIFNVILEFSIEELDEGYVFPLKTWWDLLKLRGIVRSGSGLVYGLNLFSCYSFLIHVFIDFLDFRLKLSLAVEGSCNYWLTLE